MIVIFILGPWYTKEWLSGDKSKTRQPKLQTSTVLSTAPVRINSGARRPGGVTSFVGGSVKIYAVPGRHV